MTKALRPDDAFLAAEARGPEIPIWLVGNGAPFGGSARGGAEGLGRGGGFKGRPSSRFCCRVRRELAGVLFGMGEGDAGEPCGPR